MSQGGLYFIDSHGGKRPRGRFPFADTIKRKGPVAFCVGSFGVGDGAYPLPQYWL
jgi:hypothetical protein